MPSDAQRRCTEHPRHLIVRRRRVAEASLRPVSSVRFVGIKDASRDWPVLAGWSGMSFSLPCHSAVAQGVLCARTGFDPERSDRCPDTGR